MDTTKINLSLKEIYARLCPKCQAGVRDLIKDKMTDQAIDKELKAGDEKEKGDG